MTDIALFVNFVHTAKSKTSMITVVEMRVSTEERHLQSELRPPDGSVPQTKTRSRTIGGMHAQSIAWCDDNVDPAHANDLQLLRNSTWLHNRYKADHACPKFIG
jgi:hypothetical protein